MTYLQFSTDLRNKFEKALSLKTGWGRVEIMEVFNKVLVEVLAENLDGKPSESLPIGGQFGV